MNRSGSWHATWLAFAIFLVAGLWPETAGAVPAFARRYGTSCQTCHVAVPKLTPFGEAFRRQGYRFPGYDEDYRREEPQPLGADAYKDVFPKSVWPGEIPATMPLSAVGSVTGSVARDEGDPALRGDFGGSLGLNAATPMGDWLSVWGGFAVRGSTSSGAEVELERVFFVIAPFKNPKARLRLGLLEPSVLGFSSHRTLGYMPWLLGRGVGDNEFALEPAQLGGEVEGVVAKGRLAYALGYVEGSGNDISPRGDTYARIAYKFGGLRLDGVTDGDEEGFANPAPWREWSAQVGVFGYAGFPTIGEEGIATQVDRFVIAGGDVAAILRDATVNVAYSFRHDERASLAAPSQLTRTQDAMVQVDYVVFPWFVPTLRYEYRTPTEDASHRIAPGAFFLIRANVRAMLLGRAELRDTGEVDGYRVDGGLLVAF